MESAPLNFNVKYKANPNFLIREIGNESVLVPVGDAGIFENSVLSLNKTCSFLWKQFQTPSTISEVVEKVKESFSGPAEEIENDVCRFVFEYLKFNLLLEV